MVSPTACFGEEAPQVAGWGDYPFSFLGLGAKAGVDQDASASYVSPHAEFDRRNFCIF